MLRSSFRLLLALPPLLALAGCCGNVSCNCRDSLADSLFFRFDPKFTATELDTVYLARYPKNSFLLSQSSDALPLPRGTRRPRNLTSQVAIASSDTLGLTVISNTAPFSQGSTASGATSNLSAYDYVLRLQSDSSRSKFYSYRISEIVLRGSYVGDGCCTCYRNSSKQVRLGRLNKANVTTSYFDAAGKSASYLPLTDVTDGNSSSAPRTPQVIYIPK